ncbi:hypothetical protein [Bacillus sp. Au-Bac7]|uniref:hypothetical protein n=1 Tax=Bacillus sp. Au-Bac7 TaxID=2906458 RepID=UPI001E387C8F|nr:hypothetical protein [Bacillus sp. Au-Bac7]MCE4049557.1 hypothetical protein [Bacillus sp. Au-Bac7]
MNKKALNFVKNFSYTLTSNFLSLFISTLVILIVPKLLGVEEYGYWQLYMFYISYVGFLHFGWNDGIYLRYGGKDYIDLNKKLFFSQFWMLVLFQSALLVILIIASNLFIQDIDKLFIIKMTAIGMLIVNIRGMLLYLMQATNRIKEYAQITMLEKIIYCLLIILFLVVGFRNYKILILADTAGKLFALLYSTYCCRDIVFRKISDLYISIREAFQNISVGIQLMFANIASLLIIGVVRFGIERTWDVATFGKVSLIISISNLVMIFVNAIGIVIFPLLRRTNEENLLKIYHTMRSLLMVPLLGLIIVYYPLKLIISLWLPQYADSLIYLVLIFPMCIYEGKMALLINTYLKTLRKEKLILVINIITVIFSLIFTILFTLLFKNLTLAVTSIVILVAIRCILAEKILSKILNLNVNKDILFEMLLSILFILLGWYVASIYGIIIYLITYIIYLIIKRQEIVITISELKILLKRERG